ncbi:SDR family NAD(P)-dependent oxidoreductase [Arthrobacter antioxidans]|uniref:SDR family NAD(P)-dependent oxidoreductase n=1 Tax=Arthrobacter antioxidans TaxID=2895818 RepID=UPI001FFF0FCD|nr:SDR family oxidoreductase [Arthrobacter antioxidans]
MALQFAATTALVTGASSGLGAEFARALAARGADLVLVARRVDRLEALARDLEARHGITARIVGADLADPASWARVRAFTEAEGVRVSTLVNNAGFATHGVLAEADPDRTDEEVRLNVGALTALTRLYLPDLVSEGSGALVNVASTAGFQPVPLMAVYGATKAYVRSFTAAVAWETRDTGLRVTALCPGATRTEFFDVVGSDDAKVGRYQSPEQVVRTALRALDGRRTPPVVVSGAANRVGAALGRLAPTRLGLPLTAALMRR